MTRPMRASRWLGRAGIVLGGSVAVLLLVEVGLRVFWMRRATVAAGIEHPRFHHRLKSSATYRYTSEEFDVTVRTNRHGLRGPAPAVPKPAGLVRILMMGDSFTFGFPVTDEETFCARIQEGLRARGWPVEVVNAGVSSYSPTLYYLALRDEWLAFDPDVVVLWYDLGDLQDDYRYQKNLLYDAQGRLTGADPRYVNGRFDWGEWLRNHSAVAKYLDMKLVRTLEKIRVLGLGGYLRATWRGERAKVAIAHLAATDPDHPDLMEYERFLLIRDHASDALVGPHWATSAKYLGMIQDLLAQRRVSFLLGIYPYGVVVGAEQWAQGRTYWGFEQGRTYPDGYVRDLFARFSTEHAIPLIDTFDSFRWASAQTLFYPMDGHFTPAGHEVLAAHVLEDAGFIRLVRGSLRDRRPLAVRDGR